MFLFFYFLVLSSNKIRECLFYKKNGDPLNLRPLLSEQGTVLKKYNPCEADCYQLLMSDPLAEVVPRYHRVSSVEDGRYTEIQCCLDTFNTPNICDVKMGVRTFLEGEAAITKPRHDLYLKMIKEDSAAPTESEKAAEAITKFRYLDWRDRVSSSRSLGFR